MLILIEGNMKSGKTTLADYIVKHYKEQGVRVARDYLAKPLKQFYNEIINRGYFDFQQFKNYFEYNFFPVNKEIENRLLSAYEHYYLLRNTKDKQDFEYHRRRFFQILGTDVIRAVNENFFIDKLKDRIKQLYQDKYNLIVIDDVRFLNEHKELRAFDKSVVISVKQLNIESWFGALKEIYGDKYKIVLEHQSEKEIELLPFDLRVYLDGRVLNDKYLEEIDKLVGPFIT